jgi:hypothetical protein
VPEVHRQAKREAHSRRIAPQFNNQGVNMEYAAQQQTQQGGQIGGIYRDSPKAVIEKPRIATQLDQLEKVLQECHAITSGVESAASRLLGPVPEEAGKTAGRPPSSSVEQRFAELIGIAEGLAHRLGQASQRLNQAV